MTTLRIIKVNQENLDIAMENKVWGRKRMGFKDWAVGDKLLFVVGNEVAGLAEVDGKPFKSEDMYWEDDLYPNRIAIKPVKVFTSKRVDYKEKIKPILVEEWGTQFGWQILTQQAMTGNNAEKILKLL
ncbi:hypothetical protein LLG10_06370 [bacterium]|nr:hypothetical protein [bacterium]